MRIIITGGSGLIGQALTKSLAQDGHEVVILSRSPDKLQYLPEGARAIQWDGRSAQGWGEVADGAQAVVNLAGENIAGGRWTAARKQHIRASRVQTGQAVVEAIRKAKVKPQVLIQASATGYYGPQGNDLITEDTPPGNDFLANICRAWEASTEAVEALGVRRAVIRTGVVLSQEDGALPRMALPFKLFAGGPLGSGKQWLPWIHIADEVAAIRFLIENEMASGPFNLTAPEPLTNAQFGKTMGHVLSRPAFVPTPGFALRLLFGEMATVLLDGQRAIPTKLQALGFSFQYEKAQLALEDLLNTRIYRHQFEVQASLEDVIEFHRRSDSMGAITPPPILVRLNEAPDQLREGDQMAFTLWLGPLPIRWVARIEDIEPTSFVDRQLQGPFQHWLHRHTFKAIDDNRTQVIDEVQSVTKKHPFWGSLGLGMWLNLPVLFAYRGWKTKQLLENREKLVYERT